MNLKRCWDLLNEKQNDPIKKDPIKNKRKGLEYKK